MKCQHSESWNYTRYNDIIKAAELMSIPVKQAFAMRHNFIDETIKALKAEIALDGAVLRYCDDELEFRFFLEGMVFKMKQIKKLEASRPTKPTVGEITDADIEQARAYPVDQLIKFTRGKATAFCHADKNPSMFHGSRLNVACCPVCDKTFNPVDVLMQRDGFSFIDAVKHLIGG